MHTLKSSLVMLPRPQGEQSDAAADDTAPAGHRSHVVRLAEDFLPAGQSEQAVEPLVLDHVPGGHCMQLDEPMAAEKEPAGHTSHSKKRRGPVAVSSQL